MIIISHYIEFAKAMSAQDFILVDYENFLQMKVAHGLPFKNPEEEYRSYFLTHMYNAGKVTQAPSTDKQFEELRQEIIQIKDAKKVDYLKRIFIGFLGSIFGKVVFDYIDDLEIYQILMAILKASMEHVGEGAKKIFIDLGEAISNLLIKK
ncbi:MAG: hypothetical protein HUU34_18700 [Saprospiraceae bacterium]|nr:hypothetical protein [Saprospiraceae bacterium]